MHEQNTVRALRRQADRLAHAAAHVAEREVCRDVRAEQNELRRAAGRADQRATAAEQADKW